jgi:hypothetical protein
MISSIRASRINKIRGLKMIVKGFRIVNEILPEIRRINMILPTNRPPSKNPMMFSLPAGRNANSLILRLSYILKRMMYRKITRKMEMVHRIICSTDSFGMISVSTGFRIHLLIRLGTVMRKAIPIIIRVRGK